MPGSFEVCGAAGPGHKRGGATISRQEGPATVVNELAGSFACLIILQEARQPPVARVGTAVPPPGLAQLAVSIDTVVRFLRGLGPLPSQQSGTPQATSDASPSGVGTVLSKTVLPQMKWRRPARGR